MTQKEKQELFNRSIREARGLGIVSRLTAYLFYKSEAEMKENEEKFRGERTRNRATK